MTFLETQRTRLEPFLPSEVHLMMELDSDPEVMTYLNGGRPSTLDECEEGMARIQALYQKHSGKYGLWKIFLKDTGEFAGWFLFRPCKTDPENKTEIELGYRLKKNFWGKGLATEASQAFLQLGFNQYKLEVIFATTLLGNLGSQNVMKKLGMTFDRDYLAEGFEGADKRAVRYSITKKAYELR